MTALAFVIGILVLVVGLALSIALHEIGHLVPAKKFGVRVGQYMIGFGPTLWSKRFGETEYGVKLLPLGGYISMAGMYPPSPRTGSQGRARSGFFATMVQDARAANDETLGDDDHRVFYRLPVWKRVVIMLGGPFMNLLLAVVLLTIFLVGIGLPVASSTVGSVKPCITSAAECTPGDPISPAAAAGLRDGDVLRSIDGLPVGTFAEATTIIRENPGRALAVVLDREGTTRTVTLTPAATEAEGQTIGVAGIVSSPTGAVLQRQPVWAGVQQTFANTGAVIAVVSRLPVLLSETAVSIFTGEDRDPNGPLSLVGAGAVAGEIAAADSPIVSRISDMLGLLAALNVALFVFNLIPLLPLDGGHVVVALWDGLTRVLARIRRRPPPAPVDATRLVPVTFVVVVALIAMGVVLIVADIVNPISFFR